MSSETFLWWLHGFAEITSGRLPTPEEWRIILAHLDLAFGRHAEPRPADPVDPFDALKRMAESEERARREKIQVSLPPIVGTTRIC